MFARTAISALYTTLKITDNPVLAKLVSIFTIVTLTE